MTSFDVLELDPAGLHFQRTGDTLSLRMNDGTYYSRVMLRRCFPVSDDARFIAVFDASGDRVREIGIIVDCDALPPSQRAPVLDELRSLYFVPQITRVLEIREEFGFFHWLVDTNRGQAKFVMRDGVITYTREIEPGHLLLIDLNQSRWEIPDISALDAKSLKLVKRALYL